MNTPRSAPTYLGLDLAYPRLRAAGKPAKVALVALRRKRVELASLLLKSPALALTQ